MGKLQTHEFGGKSHVPLLICHPNFGQGQQRNQIIQLVDIYATVLSLMGKPVPEKRHGCTLVPVLQDEKTKTRDYAIMGQFGYSISITDGRWTLHVAPRVQTPLYWYSHYLSRFFDIELGPYKNGRRRVLGIDPPLGRDYRTTWLTDRYEDPGEIVNLAARHPEKVLLMRKALKKKLVECEAPPELLKRFGLTHI